MVRLFGDGRTDPEARRRAVVICAPRDGSSRGHPEAALKVSAIEVFIPDCQSVIPTLSVKHGLRECNVSGHGHGAPFVVTVPTGVAWVRQAVALIDNAAALADLERGRRCSPRYSCARSREEAIRPTLTPEDLIPDCQSIMQTWWDVEHGRSE